jgi:CheY-like chemotaxis protein
MELPEAKKTVLVLDDDPEFADMVADVLSDAGFDAVKAADAWAALKLLDGGKAFDLLLADVVLPKGMPHGFAVARMAAYKRPGLKVIYVTAYPKAAEPEFETALGPILRKPIAPDELVNQVRRSFDAH